MYILGNTHVKCLFPLSLPLSLPVAVFCWNCTNNSGINCKAPLVLGSELWTDPEPPLTAIQDFIFPLLTYRSNLHSLKFSWLFWPPLSCAEGGVPHPSCDESSPDSTSLGAWNAGGTRDPASAGTWLRQLLLAHPAQSRIAQESIIPEERITSRWSQQWLRARSCAHPCLLMRAGRKKGVRAAKAPLSCLFPFCLLKPSLLFSWSQVTGLRATLGSGSSWFSLAGCGEHGSARDQE